MKRRCEGRRNGVRDKTKARGPGEETRVGDAWEGVGSDGARDGEGAGDSWMFVEVVGLGRH